MICYYSLCLENAYCMAFVLSVFHIICVEVRNVNKETLDEILDRMVQDCINENKKICISVVSSDDETGELQKNNENQILLFCNTNDER